MKKIKEYHICDKCKKEIQQEEIQKAYYINWYYELCNDCYKTYEEFQSKIKKIRIKYDKLEKEYQFGEYLPEEEAENENI